jgi:hypothetical protein
MAKPKAKNDTGATLGFEAKLWAAADALRNNMDAAEYEHVVLGLIFLKYSPTRSRPSMPSSSRSVGRALIPRTPTSTAPLTSSGCRRKRAGPT